MGASSRLMLLATFACLGPLLNPIFAQTDLFVTGMASRPASTMQELMEQQPALFDEEQRLLASNANAPAAITIGDSITNLGYDSDGWVSLLKQAYPDVLFVNKGVSMGNTRSSLIISKWTLDSERSPLYNQPDRLKLVTFCFGANDAAISLRNATWRMVQPAEYKQNLLTSIDIFQAHGVNQILLLTPPPAASPPRIDRRLDATAEYAELVKQVGLERRLPVVDIFAAIQGVPDWKTAAMVKDGLHLSPVGQRVVFDLVQAAIADAQYQM